MRYFIVYLAFFAFNISSLYSQDIEKSEAIKEEESQDVIITADGHIAEDGNIESFEKKSKLDPQRAALLSAVLPGLGQIYNGHVWKLPILYGGAALFGTWISYNNRLYQIFKNDELTTINFGKSKLRSPPDENFVRRNRETFRRNRDYAVIITSLFYLLNIVDAHVSAHLKEFEVNEDLSMKVSPHVEKNPGSEMTVSIGLKLSLKFK